METVGVIALVMTVLALRYWFGLSLHRRQWVGTFEGHRISVVVRGNRLRMDVDGETVLETPLEHRMRPVTTMGGLRFRQSFRYDIHADCAALGGQKVSVTSADWHHSNRGAITVKVGDRRILVEEITDPDIVSAADVFASLEAGRSPISDERWPSVQHLLVQIRTALAGQPMVVQATQQLSQHLQARFGMLEELSGPHAAQVWADQEERTALIDGLEEEIASAMAAIQDLHRLSIRQRQDALNDSDMGAVEQLMGQLLAAEEVNEAADTHQDRLQRWAAARRQRTPGS